MFQEIPTSSEHVGVAVYSVIVFTSGGRERIIIFHFMAHTIITSSVSYDNMVWTWTVEFYEGLILQRRWNRVNIFFYFFLGFLENNSFEKSSCLWNCFSLRKGFQYIWCEYLIKQFFLHLLKYYQEVKLGVGGNLRNYSSNTRTQPFKKLQIAIMNIQSSWHNFIFQTAQQLPFICLYK